MDIARLGQLLHMRRVERNITLREVESETGITASTLNRLEMTWTKKREAVAPRTETIEILANWLGVSLESLLTLRATKQEWKGILNDSQIAEAVSLYGMIDPFVDHKIQDGISYGLQPYGYDIRTGENYFLDGWRKGDIVIPPHSYALLESLEYFKIPPNVLCIIQGKSTYARMGLILNCTPDDPGWEGRWTLCAVNPTSFPIEIRAEQGIAQVLFFAGDLPQTTYKGKYQGDASLSPAKL